VKAFVGAPFDQWRDRSAVVIRHFGDIGDQTCGVFNMPVGATMLFIVASTGEGWDHVSVSLPNRCPTWEEMSAVKRAFFRRNEWACELHPPESDNLSLYPYCLHIWRCQFADMPLPDSIMVAPSKSVIARIAS
jgi:hypothetical protein